MVNVKSYRKEREKEIMDGLQKSMERVGNIVERQAALNVRAPLPSGKSHAYADTDRLARSVTHKTETSGSKITAIIGTNVDYGLYLELGYYRGKSQVHYPWLFPAVELKKPEIIDAIKGKGKLKGIEVVGGIWEK